MTTQTRSGHCSRVCTHQQHNRRHSNAIRALRSSKFSASLTAQRTEDGAAAAKGLVFGRHSRGLLVMSTPPVVIRLATPDDIEWLAQAQADIITSEGDACDVLEERKVARMRVLQDRVLVAMDAASLVRQGWLAYTFAEAVPFGVDYGNMDEPYLWVEAVYVEPESRGKGIGTFLYAEAETLARAKGVATILMDVYEVNTKSKAFHEKAGYKPWVTVWRKEVKFS